ncbi:hypothetical protein INS49_009069 [Diaporthe citri]|uniref:uncharacterized protein n=1 Tax=Diaporthe citri TaxID=83186 RepID=UPI001C80C1BB|nr:uncharacterized protein INS49_009069 [Diaporthe citri]KAG6363966.1 hypothetical protein INS49_009069 [Diaporthe citri]
MDPDSDQGHEQQAKPDSTSACSALDTASSSPSTSATQTPQSSPEQHAVKPVVVKISPDCPKIVLPHLPRRKGRSWLFRFEEGVLMKQSYDTRTSECAAMQYVHQHAPSVPVPEVYESDFDDPRVGRIFMEEIPGDTLEKVWPSLDPFQKELACRDLWDIIMALRQIPRPAHIPPERCLYTTVDGSPLYPQGGLTGNEVAPLREDQYNTDDAFRNFIIQRYRENHGPSDEVRNNFPRSETAVFTHGDIKPRNIMASADGRITSLLDFEYAGFMPEYWEDLGMFMEIWEWEQDWADTMMRTKPSSWDFEAPRALCRVAKRVLHF